MQLSSESDFLIPKSGTQKIPIVVCHLMNLDDSQESFDSAIITEKMAEVSRVIAVIEPSQG